MSRYDTTRELFYFRQISPGTSTEVSIFCQNFEYGNGKGRYGVFCFGNVLDGLYFDENFQNLKSKTPLYFESNLSKYRSGPSGGAGAPAPPSLIARVASSLSASLSLSSLGGSWLKIFSARWLPPLGGGEVSNSQPRTCTATPQRAKQSDRTRAAPASFGVCGTQRREASPANGSPMRD